MGVRQLIACFAGVVAIAQITLADTIVLKDGTVLDGVVKQVTDGYEIVSADGKSNFIPKADVKSIKLSNEGKVTEQSAKERLASLRRSVDAEEQIDRILERYEQFIEMNKETDAAAEAQKDIDLWRQRKAQGMLKVGTRWMTPGQRDEYLVSTAKLANEIADQIAAGDIAGATTRLASGLEEDPKNLSLAYLDGVLQLRRGRFSEAKRSFDVVMDQVPEHPPTLYNEAVIAANFKRWPLALPMLEKAMSNAPNHPEILNGVVEFLRLVPDGVKRTAAFDRLLTLYTAQEAVLAAEMAKKGLYRFGSDWAPQAKIDELNKKLAEFEEKKKALQAEFDASQERSRQLQRDIERIETQLNEIEYDRARYDPVTRRTYYMPRPQIYYDLVADKDRRAREINDERSRGEEIRKQAKDLESQAPQPPFTGKIAPIGEAGVPIVLPAGAEAPPPIMPATPPTNKPPLPLWPLPEPAGTQPSR